MAQSHWADQHVKSQGVQYRDTKPAKPPSGGGMKILATLIVVGALGGGGFWAYQSAIAEPTVDKPANTATAAMEPAAVGPATESTDYVIAVQPIAAPTPVAVGTEQAEATNAAQLARQRETIERGVATLEKQLAERQQAAAGFQAQITKATTERAYPPEERRFTYLQWMADLRQKAVKAQASTVKIDNSIEEFHAKLRELQGRLSHEQDIITSLNKRIAAEQAKMP